MEEALKLAGMLLIAAVYAAGAFIVLAMIWAFIWIMAYPAIGYECTKESTVVKYEAIRHSGWTGTTYSVTYDDGDKDQGSWNTMFTGKTICRDYRVDFPW